MSQYRLYAMRIGLVGVTNALLSISLLLLLPIITKNVSIDDYSTWVQVTVTINLIPTVVPLGLPYAMVRFLTAAKVKDLKQEGFYSILGVVTLTSLTISLMIFGLSDPIAAALFNKNVHVTRLLSLVIFIECINTLFLNFFRTFLRMKIYSSILVIKSYLNLALVAFLVFLGYGIIGAIWGLILTSASIFLIMAYLIIKDIGYKKPKFRNIKEYLAFGIPTIPSNLSSWVITSSACYVISILLGTVFVGYYQPGYSLGNISLIFLGPFSVMLSAVLARYYEDGDVSSVRTVLKYSSKGFLALAIPSAFGLSFLSKPMLEILSTPLIASKSYMITPFIAFGAILYGMYAFFAEIIVLKKKTEITGMIWVLAGIFNLVLNMLLIPSLGVLGGAVAVLATYAFALALCIYYSSRYLPIELDLKFALKSILASSMMSLLIIKINPAGTMMVVAVILASAIFYFLVLLLLGGFKKEELAFIRGILGGGA